MRQVEHDGVVYPSVSACARALGISRGKVMRGNFEPGNSRYRKVEVYNRRLGISIIYPTIREAYLTLGVIETTFLTRIKNNQWIFTDNTAVKARYV